MKIYKILRILFVLTALSFAAFGQMNVSEQAAAHIQKGESKLAVKLLEPAVKKDAGNAALRSLLGTAYLEDKQYKKAEKTFQKAIESNPGNDSAQAGLAVVYLLREKDEKSFEAAQKALQINDKNADANYVLGVQNFREGLFQAAYDYANKVIAVNPQFAKAYLLKSESLAQSSGLALGTASKTRQERAAWFSEARESLETYLRLAPKNAEAAEQRERLEGLRFFTEYYASRDLEAKENPNAVTTPAKVHSAPRAEYTGRALERRTTGIVKLAVLLSADGKASYAVVLKPLPDGLTESALKAAKGIKFTPATKDGKPISVVKVVEFGFNFVPGR